MAQDATHTYLKKKKKEKSTICPCRKAFIRMIKDVYYNL